ncbi:MAG TPA: PPC domain-containing protein [Longimicrobiaceae bacterium]
MNSFRDEPTEWPRPSRLSLFLPILDLADASLPEAPEPQTVRQNSTCASFVAMLKPVILTAVGSALLFGSAPALAQLPQIRHGEPIGGTLSPTDATNGDDAYSDAYVYHGKRGERLTISLRSEDFDAYLFFAKIVDGLPSEGTMQGDDDGAGGTDALLEVVLEEDGEYAVVATSYSPGQTGAYRLALLSDGGIGGEGGNASESTISIGTSIRGSLGPGDELLDDGSYYDLYTLRARAGQQVEIVLLSNDFDAYLSVGRLTDWDATLIDSDDDGAGGTDSRLLLTIDEDGEYWIRANSLGEGETGAYSLTLTEVESRPALAPIGALAAGEERDGELGPPDPRLQDGSYFDEYVYRGRAGERLTIDLESDDFDAFLVIGRRVNGAFEYLEGNDDHDETLNSRLEYTVPEDGEYIIRANSMAGDSTGRYTLRLRSSR